MVMYNMSVRITWYRVTDDSSGMHIQFHIVLVQFKNICLLRPWKYRKTVQPFTDIKFMEQFTQAIMNTLKFKCFPLFTYDQNSLVLLRCVSNTLITPAIKWQSESNCFTKPSDTTHYTETYTRLNLIKHFNSLFKSNVGGFFWCPNSVSICVSLCWFLEMNAILKMSINKWYIIFIYFAFINKQY